MLEPFVSTQFLRNNNLRLIDVRCRSSNISRNCGISSYLSYTCRKGYSFSNRKVIAVTTCNTNGQWASIPVCVESKFKLMVFLYLSFFLIFKYANSL